MSDVKQLLKSIADSSFAKTGNSVNIPMRNIIKSMEVYTNIEKYCIYQDKRDTPISSTKEFLSVAVPEFQRDNNKWTKDMQISFVENTLSGAKTNILLFQLKGESNYQIMDGLQRITAMLEFLDGKFDVFEKYGGFTSEQLKDYLDSFNTKIVLTKYTLDSWKEVGQFYIAMNENITHSKEDIQKAKDWFLENHEINL